MTNFLNWLDTLSETYLYIAVLVSSFVENMFTPLPGDTVTVFGAYLAGTGRADPFLIGVFATIGGTAGFMGLFLVGRYFIKRGEVKGKFLGIKLEKIEKAGASFNKWGYWVVAFNRFFYGLRFAIALFAGLSRLDIKRTLIFALAGTILWNIVLVYLGSTLGANWDAFKGVIWSYNRIIIGVIGGFIIIYIYFRYRRRRKI